MLQKVLLIACAGALGTVCRYGLAGLVQRLAGVGFPWGTFACNIVGSFMFGLIWSMAEERIIISGETRVIILSGFMGAFTTFSTFMFETSGLLQDSEWWLAAGNLFGQCALGILFLFLGLAVGKLI